MQRCLGNSFSFKKHYYKSEEECKLFFRVKLVRLFVIVHRRGRGERREIKER